MNIVLSLAIMVFYTQILTFILTRDLNYWFSLSVTICKQMFNLSRACICLFWLDIFRFWSLDSNSMWDILIGQITLLGCVWLVKILSRMTSVLSVGSHDQSIESDWSVFNVIWPIWIPSMYLESKCWRT